MGFLIFIFIFLFLFWPVIRIMFAVNKAKKGMRDLYEEARKQQEAQQQAAREEQKRKRKIFAKDEGEYVEFEEVAVTESSTATDNAGHTETRRETRVESQITDVEWEEL